MKRTAKIKTIDLCMLALIGAIMFVTKLAMTVLPNIHLLGLFIVATALVFRWKTLLAIYTYVLLDGIYYGFATWWIPYLYIWDILLIMAILAIYGIEHITKNNILYANKKSHTAIFMLIASVFGLCFGTLYAPMQALFFGLNFKGMLAWIVAGIPFDIIHSISNFAACAFAIPLAKLIQRIKNSY